MNETGSDMSWSPCCFEEEMDELCIRNIIMIHELPVFEQFLMACEWRDMTPDRHAALIPSSSNPTREFTLAPARRGPMPWSPLMKCQYDYDIVRKYIFNIADECREAATSVDKELAQSERDNTDERRPKLILARVSDIAHNKFDLCDFMDLSLCDGDGCHSSSTPATGTRVLSRDGRLTMGRLSWTHASTTAANPKTPYATRIGRWLQAAFCSQSTRFGFE